MNKPVLSFLHVPKTAGSSLGHAIHRQYKSSSIYFINGNYPEKSVEKFISLSEEERNQYSCISGHIPFGIHKYISGQVVYLAMIRNPVERLISLYHHVLRETTHYLHEAIVAPQMSLLEFIESGLSRELTNDQTRIISGVGQWNQRTDQTIVDESVLKEAVNNIEEFFPVVGLTEMFDESLMLMKDAFSWHSVLYSKRKVADSRIGQTPLDMHTINTIRDQNQYDVMLYEYAKQRLQRQLTDRGLLFNSRVQMFRSVNSIYNQVRTYRNAPGISICWKAVNKMMGF